MIEYFLKRFHILIFVTGKLLENYFTAVYLVLKQRHNILSFSRYFLMIEREGFAEIVSIVGCCKRPHVVKMKITFDRW